jgi:hypothetical protein
LYIVEKVFIEVVFLKMSIVKFQYCRVGISPSHDFWDIPF